MSKNLYDVAKEITLELGMPWTDPRTLLTLPASEEETTKEESEETKQVETGLRPGLAVRRQLTRPKGE